MQLYTDLPLRKQQSLHVYVLYTLKIKSQLMGDLD